MGMTVKKTVRTDNVQRLKEVIKELKSKKIKIGIFGSAGSHILMIASVNEFGCHIAAKNVQHLAIPINPKAVGRGPRSFNDLFFLKDSKGDLWLCKNKGKDDLEFYYWLPTSVNIPSRSFIRGSYNANQSIMQNFIEKNLGELFNFNITVDTFCNRVGEYLAGLTRKYLTDLKEPKKHWSTLAAYPGKDNPLILTGKLRQSITFVVE
jgi:hypothetical protein